MVPCCQQNQGNILNQEGRVKFIPVHQARASGTSDRLDACAVLRGVVQAFSALQDIKTPVKIGTYTMLPNLVLSTVLMLPGRHPGPVLTISLAPGVSLVVLRVLLRRHWGWLPGGSVLHGVGKGLGASSAGERPVLSLVGIVLGRASSGGPLLLLRRAAALCLAGRGR
jgi:peptidoglycan biosynthesis protein MviN/MurJ (putative lipid II flippase)